MATITLRTDVMSDEGCIDPLPIVAKALPRQLDKFAAGYRLFGSCMMAKHLFGCLPKLNLCQDIQTDLLPPAGILDLARWQSTCMAAYQSSGTGSLCSIPSYSQLV